MITTIGYKNFKCFGSEINIPTGSINLLAGVNGRGKSTTIQGLLLMRQSPELNRTTDQIIFNGSCVELGSFDDVRNSEVSRTETIELSFDFGDNGNTARLTYVLGENVNDDMVAQIRVLDINGMVNDNPYNLRVFPGASGQYFVKEGKEFELLWKNLLFEKVENSDESLDFIRRNVDFTKTHYVSADRIGPRDFYIKQSFGEFPNVGRRGEYTANVLSKKGEDVVNAELCLLSGATNILTDQTGAWLSKIFDGGTVRVKTTDANLVILSMNSEESTVTYKPTNVGFGYSYALPIIVSGLIAKPGEILIVENPEAHLHPYAQSQITRFLSKVSTTGVQVFIESHSDHVLNGLRIDIKDQLIQPENLHVLYFDRTAATRVTRIPVERNGSITDWPTGFFDQTNADFSKLFGV